MEINQEFIAAAEPLVNFLRKHKHPHAKIIVDQTGAEVVEGILSTGAAFDYPRDSVIISEGNGRIEATGL